MTNTEKIQASGSRPSRRTIVKGAAWAVPAIAVANAAPAFAASKPCLTAAVSADSCKCPGQSTGDPFGYKLGLCFTNNCTTDITNLVVTQVQNNSGALIYTTKALTTPLTYAPISIPAGQKVCTGTLTGYSSNSAGKLDVTFTINGGAPQTITISAPPQCDKLVPPAPCPA